jgi:ABC-type uncharacterized transport system ATPase subunit
VEVKLKEGADPQEFLQSVVREVRINRFELMEPSLNDIFISSVQKNRQGEENHEQ